MFASAAFASEKVTIEADSVETPEKSVYHAKGNVKVFQGDKTMIADEIIYDKTTNFIHAIGNVTLSEGGTVMECSELEYNTETESGIFTDARGFIPPYNWIKAAKLNRLSPYTYNMEDVSFTTCDGDRPDWSFKASEANLTVGGYISSWHTTARIKDVPVLYTPYFVYPVKTERETGFLIPDLGYNSDMGPYIKPKFFWNLGVDQDATITALLPANAPVLYGLEHRYIPSNRSSIYTYAEYTDDEKMFPEETSGGDYNLSTKPGRFFIYNKSNVKLSDKLYFRSFIDTVSDYEYLSDYQRYNLMGDEYENDTDIYKVNFALSYLSPLGTLSLKYRDNTDYSVGQRYIKEHVISQPQIELIKNITNLPIYLRYHLRYDNVRYTKYWYSYSTNVNSFIDRKYEREHASFRFYRPVNLYIATFTPSLTLFYTRWHNFDYEPNMPSDYYVSSFANLSAGDDSVSRKIYRQSHTIKFNEIYKYYENFKHTIYFSLKYVQTPRIVQSGLVDYMANDKIDWQKEYQYSVANYLTGDTWSASLVSSVIYDMTQTTEKYQNYINKLSLDISPVKLYSVHKFNKYDNDTEFLHTKASLDINPFLLWGSYTYDYDDYMTEDNNTSLDIGLKYTSDKYDLEYVRSASGMNERMTTGNMEDVEDIISITYKEDCWALGLSYIRETSPKSVDVSDSSETEHTVLVTFSLRGLGNDDPSLFRPNFAAEESDEEY